MAGQINSIMYSSDERITELIAELGNRPADDRIAGEEDPAVFYNLSSLRHALLSWFPFGKEWSVLEVGGGYGAMTGLLLERCAGVDVLERLPGRAAAIRRRYGSRTGLRVICADALDFSPAKKYDCIVLIDVLEDLGGDLSPFAARCTRWLAPGGVLISGWRNPFGLHYLCGGVDERIPVPYAGVGHDPLYGGGALFTRRKVTDTFAAVGLAVDTMAYPLPNAAFAQLILTDDSPEKDSVLDRVFSFDAYGSARVLSENGLYNDVIRSGMLPHLANDYLAVFRRASETGESRRRVTYAALSCDRGREHGFVTALFSDGTAEKRAISLEGIPGLRAMCAHARELEEHGVRTVEQRMERDRIVMPLVTAPPLLNVVHEAADRRDRDRIFAVFDRIYENALRSSEPGTVSEEEALGIWGQPAEKLSPILRRGYPDMIPYNAFWENEDAVYCDQEFCVENCPAGYILFRAIRYTWIHIPELESFLPRAEMAERFGLTALWDSFMAREERFVNGNRNIELFAQVYRWRYRTDADLRENRLRLLSPQAEARERLLLTAVHSVQKELLRRFDRICRRLGVRYFAIHGTLLGAARHGGFIPWDNDVDIAMPREDFDRFAAEAPRLRGSLPVPEGLDAELEHFYGGYLKLRVEDPAALAPDIPKEIAGEIRVDILPLDRCPDGDALREVQERIRTLQEALFALGGSAERPEGKAADLLARLHRELTAAPPNSKRLGLLACYYGDRRNINIYDRRVFDDTVWLPFENMRLPAPAGYETILRERYGADYMLLPPKERRRSPWGSVPRPYADPPEQNLAVSDSTPETPRAPVKPYGTGLVMGVFDLFHIGHLNLIRRAKSLCRRLRVGVLTDELVFKFKGITPTIPLDQRMAILEALKDVDEVVAIEEDPSRIIEWHKRPFDCFFSGDDYAGNEYWEWERRELRELGSDIVFFPYTKGQSSSGIRRQLENNTK